MEVGDDRARDRGKTEASNIYKSWLVSTQGLHQQFISSLTQAMKTETRPWRPTLCSPSVGTGWTAPPWLKISNETGIEIHLSEVVVCIYLPRHSAGLCRRFREVNKTRERMALLRTEILLSSIYFLLTSGFSFHWTVCLYLVWTVILQALR